ncbi:uncharacterized protein LOC135829526 [Sycon ciliatum]|uniref:uncharacterized protein LOC135829526 n=1 Tax=Sycon ciliatum TaxID=27933 RepID=UPI0031F61DD9
MLSTLLLGRCSLLALFLLTLTTSHALPRGRNDRARAVRNEYDWTITRRSLDRRISDGVMQRRDSYHTGEVANVFGLVGSRLLRDACGNVNTGKRMLGSQDDQEVNGCQTARRSAARQLQHGRRTLPDFEPERAPYTVTTAARSHNNARYRGALSKRADIAGQEYAMGLKIV